jgi:psiF repeat-containing protein
MRTSAIVATAFCLVATAALADDSCKVQATGKNLHGAALTSFAKKCCNDQATAQNLHGAAQTSFTKKCLSDATGS